MYYDTDIPYEDDDDDFVALVKERPYFSRKQVRTLAGVKVGHSYYRHHGAFKSTNKRTIIDIIETDFGLKAICEDDADSFYLADAGVISYQPQGTWNPTNWLERA